MPPAIAPKSQTKALRRAFLLSLILQLRVIWPIFSGILFAMVGIGFLIGWIENWRLDEALYFTFVTALTIGYGDLTPHSAVTRFLAIVIGFAGIILTGLVAAVAVQALQAAGNRTA